MYTRRAGRKGEGERVDRAKRGERGGDRGEKGERPDHLHFVLLVFSLFFSSAVTIFYIGCFCVFRYEPYS